MVFIGYLNYVVVLSVMTGVFILMFDVKGYKTKNMQKERKVSTFLGWFNITAGVLAFLVNWAYQHIFW
ncbi:CLC_0170 family protein [Fredinandcohnia salidurans]|uniref:CLC_0170 family protein n=1 Tax=Fredinandcohnia salidurans TaxID=2595041 RepID=A0ABW4MMX9_9BACI